MLLSRIDTVSAYWYCQTAYFLPWVGSKTYFDFRFWYDRSIFPIFKSWIGSFIARSQPLWFDIGEQS